MAMLAVLIIVPFAVLKWIDRYTRHGEAVVVPDVKGLHVDQARAAFASRNLQVQVADSTYVEGEPAGCILDCNPPAGQKVKEGRIVYLTINTLNVPLQEVPDVADNSSAREAQMRLLAAGFELTDNDSVPGETDWVYSVKCNGRELRPKEKVPMGATLTLVVGNGMALPDTTAVDSLAAGTDSLGLERKPAAADGKKEEEDVEGEDSWF